MKNTEIKLNEYQIRTNAKSFGENYGVYVMDQKDKIYEVDFKGETFSDSRGEWTYIGQNFSKTKYMYESQFAVGKFVKQMEFSHGTFKCSPDDVKTLLNKLQDNARNCWVRLYKMS